MSIYKSKLGWKPQLPDYRDYQYTISLDRTSTYNSVDLRPYCPPIYDQGYIGSCTSNAIAGAYEFEKMKQRQAYFVPSRLFIYYNERSMEGTIPYDAGASLRDGIKSVNRQGACRESLWPYVESKFAAKPSSQCYTDALRNKISVYLSIPQNLTLLKNSLISGYPFVFGFTVYTSFFDISSDGKMRMPQPKDIVEGGHACCIVGFDDKSKHFIVRNSWGDSWGDRGYFYMPYDYITNSGLASDFWSIRLVS